MIEMIDKKECPQISEKFILQILETDNTMHINQR